MARLNWNIFLYFYDFFLGETPLNTHQKMISAPRYRRDTVFHWNCLIQMLFKIILSNIFIFCCSFFCVSHIRPYTIHFPLVRQVKVKLLNWNLRNFKSFLKRLCPIVLVFKIVFEFWNCLKTPNLIMFLSLVIPQHNISMNFWNFEYFLNISHHFSKLLLCAGIV